jgi:UDP-N-acetylmuramoylalanine--D-glutamate ligase
MSASSSDLAFAAQAIEVGVDFEGDTGRTLVVGLGSTGLSAARFLRSHGATVCVIDSRPAPPLLDELERCCPDIDVRVETLDVAWLDGASRLVLSPGLSTELPLVVAARERGIPVVSDIELFAQAAEAPVAAVTGSNGKSTVTTLTQRLLVANGIDAVAGGNLSPPALDLLDERPDVYVLEISSFQMETTESLHPSATALLNVSADHLDRHGTLARYAALKQKLLDAAHTAIYNDDDPLVRTMGIAHPNGIAFSVTHAPDDGYGILTVDDARWLARRNSPIFPAARLRVRGRHNEANALAAIALAEAVNGSELASFDALEQFAGLAHRCEFVAELAGVTFINDSKGTNVGATVAALEGLDGPFVLIAGGQAKGASFAPLAQAARGRLLAAVLIGESAPEIGRALAGVCATEQAASLDQAVARAHALAEPGASVLLSPACASFDMFKSYEDRGEQFKTAVEELAA